MNAYVVPFAEYFGIKPWEIRRLRRDHFLALRARADELTGGVTGE